jgi:hypothetical protein
LAAALEIAFDPDKSTACIGLGQTARDQAAAWLPPGMAYATEPNGSGDEAIDEADATDGETDGTDPAAADLPSFLTEDEPALDHAATP